jgi:hypothetical protein
MERARGLAVLDRPDLRRVIAALRTSGVGEQNSQEVLCHALLDVLEWRHAQPTR